MLSLARKIPHAHQHVQEDKWQRNTFKGIELYKKTLGIIGFGNIGRALAKRAKAFDMRVLAYDPVVKHDVFTEEDVQSVLLAQLLTEADFLSLHCGLNENTRNIISAQNIAQMKKGAMLINTARGELIDNDALILALETGHIAGAALDVFRTEPPAKKDPLVNHPRVIVTPHLGASTAEAQLRVSTQLAEQTVSFFSECSKAINRIV